MITADTAFELSESIRQLLKLGSAMRAHDLADYFQTNPKRVEQALQILLHSGTVETLKPVGKVSERDNSVYYRLKEEQDELHAWQRLLWGKKHCSRHRTNRMLNALA